MDICIAYYSRYGNGRKCAEYLAGSLTTKGHSVQVFSVKETRADALPAADLYIFSSPTQIGSPPGKMKRFVKRFTPPDGGGAYAIMATYADEKTKTVKKLSAILDAKGLKQAAAGLKLEVLGLKGPLEDGYEGKLDTFAEQLSGP